jgi:hypothetical protein
MSNTQRGFRIQQVIDLIEQDVRFLNNKKVNFLPVQNGIVSNIKLEQESDRRTPNPLWLKETSEAISRSCIGMVPELTNDSLVSLINSFPADIVRPQNVIIFETSTRVFRIFVPTNPAAWNASTGNWVVLNPFSTVVPPGFPNTPPGEDNILTKLRLPLTNADIGKFLSIQPLVNPAEAHKSVQLRVVAGNTVTNITEHEELYIYVPTELLPLPTFDFTDPTLHRFNFKQTIANPNPRKESVRDKGLRFVSRNIVFEVYSAFEKVEMIGAVLSDHEPYTFIPNYIPSDLDRFNAQSRVGFDPVVFPGLAHPYYTIAGEDTGQYKGRYNTLEEATRALILPSFRQDRISYIEAIDINGIAPNGNVAARDDWFLNVWNGWQYVWSEGIPSGPRWVPRLIDFPDLWGDNIGSIVEVDHRLYVLADIPSGPDHRFIDWWIADLNLIATNYIPFTLDPVTEETIQDAINKGWLVPWLPSDPNIPYRVFDSGIISESDWVYEYGFDNFWYCIVTYQYDEPTDDSFVLLDIIRSGSGDGSPGIDVPSIDIARELIELFKNNDFIRKSFSEAILGNFTWDPI